jgi:hypothetical protein
VSYPNSVQQNTEHHLSPLPAGAQLPDHLIGVPGGEWAFWRWACLRGAGFPAHLVERLAAPDCATVADDILRIESEIEERGKDAAAALERELEAVTDRKARKQLVKVLKQLKRGEAPKYSGGEALQAIQAFATAQQSAAEARARYKEIFRTSRREIACRIREMCIDPLFRQAVLLQNRNALNHVIEFFAGENGGPKSGFKARQHEELIANYVQRYCLKNDTVGFFGPVGWARLDPDAQGLTCKPGPNLVSASSIYFENWGIEALADKIAEDTRLLPWMAPRLLPFFRVEENTLYLPAGNPAPIPPLYATILNKCNGEKTARQIALEVLKTPGSGLSSEPQVYGVLQQMCTRKILSWKFELPYSLHPERRLRTLLERIEPADLSAPAIQALDELERTRDKVNSVVGDPVELDEALGQLDTVFTRVTSQQPTRAGGVMYASRTLTYQDCMRDVDVQIGPDVLDAMSEPLTLLLTATRWFSYQVAHVCRGLFNRLYRELTNDGEQTSCTFMEFGNRVSPILYDSNNHLLDEVIADFRNRWAQVFSAPSQERRAQFQAAEVKEKVERLFAVPAVGWELARYHSPDVMIAASDPEAISQGDCFFVLGELHVATNTCRGSFMVGQHPFPHELYDAIERDLPNDMLLAVPPRHWPRLTNRTSMALVPSKVHFLEAWPDNIADAPRSRVVPISELVVEDSTDGLIVRTRDGRLSFKIIDAFGDLLSTLAVDTMKFVNSTQHAPRITIDRVVVSRESWSIDAAELDFVETEDEDERYLKVRRWANGQGFPRRVFVKITNETKPFYVDFYAPVYVGILVKMLRRARTQTPINKQVVISEMLPTPDQLWLRDSSQNTYTSELRIVSRDLAG